jgi:hypothetical protein
MLVPKANAGPGTLCRYSRMVPLGIPTYGTIEADRNLVNCATCAAVPQGDSFLLTFILYRTSHFFPPL